MLLWPLANSSSRDLRGRRGTEGRSVQAGLPAQPEAGRVSPRQEARQAPAVSPPSCLPWPGGLSHRSSHPLPQFPRMVSEDVQLLPACISVWAAGGTLSVPLRFPPRPAPCLARLARHHPQLWKHLACGGRGRRPRRWISAWPIGKSHIVGEPRLALCLPLTLAQGGHVGDCA